MPSFKDVVYNHLLITIIYILFFKACLDAIMSFTQVPTSSYAPYMYFIIALIVLNSFLEKSTGFTKN
jgi:hypothetical protein